MRNKFYLCHHRIPMNIQFFAEDGGGAGEGDDGGTGTDGGSGAGGNGGGNGAMSFDDFLKGEGNQAEFDRRVQKAINTAVKNAQEKWEMLTDDKVSEAEKLAKMTKEEKAEYLSKKKETELAGREAEITKRELMAEAKNTLAEKGLPVGLAEVLVYTDADSCNKSIATVEKAFQDAVKTATEEKLKGGQPPRKPGQDGEEEMAKQVEKIMRGI